MKTILGLGLFVVDGFVAHPGSAVATAPAPSHRKKSRLDAFMCVLASLHGTDRAVLLCVAVFYSIIKEYRST